MQFKLIENGDSVRKHDRDILKQVIFNLKEDEDCYIILEPKKPIENSIYLQVIIHKGLYKVETRLIFGSDDDFKHYSNLYSTAEEVLAVFDDYYSDCRLPDLRKWTDDTSSFKEESDCDMVKLYKTFDGAIHYFEVWIDEDNTLTTHEGILGEIGETESFTEPDKDSEFLPPRIAMAKAIKTYQDLGYISDILSTELILQYPVKSGTSKTAISEDIESIEGILNNCLGWTGNGHCDGGDTENGIATFFCYVIDKAIATETIIEALDEEGFLFNDLKIAYADEKTEEYKLLYPNEGTFSLI
ncbi:hypothetical protein [Dysgonomonas macrotermitis]|uniref:Uncharacterized protein n=1 Tax=Dysgonomonas macrotermitis TaxID=1346286 RepID=A0A1M5DB33_9BACT|nr:hypothetical protein [Dysgonomonas macrotermitis]SHF64197.1 hypothetical protein SAMN05444362_108136 [Dysgonomonas macrotermitis]